MEAKEYPIQFVRLIDGRALHRNLDNTYSFRGDSKKYTYEDLTGRLNGQFSVFSSFKLSTEVVIPDRVLEKEKIALPLGKYRIVEENNGFKPEVNIHGSWTSLTDLFINSLESAKNIVEIFEKGEIEKLQTKQVIHNL